MSSGNRIGGFLFIRKLQVRPSSMLLGIGGSVVSNIS